MITETVSGKAGEFEYGGDIYIFESVKEYKTYLKDNRNSEDVDGDVLKAVNDYEGRRQRQTLRSDANPALGGTGAREVNRGVKDALEAGVSPEELSAAIAQLQASKN